MKQGNFKVGGTGDHNYIEVRVGADEVLDDLVTIFVREDNVENGKSYFFSFQSKR